MLEASVLSTHYRTFLLFHAEGAIGDGRHTGLVGCVPGVYGCLSVSSQVVGLLPLGFLLSPTIWVDDLIYLSSLKK